MAETKNTTAGTESSDSAPVTIPATAPAAGIDTSTAGKKASDKDGTTLDSNVTKPSVTKPGDGPADTTDPTEVATSVSPGVPSAEAVASGTVNAVVKVGNVTSTATAVADGDGRTETFETRNPKGDLVTVVRNIDTGVSSVKKS